MNFGSLNFQPLTLPGLTAKIAGDEPFALTRWGDGEWRCILGPHKGANCDGVPYEAGLSNGLRRVLQKRPNYLLGMQPQAWRESSPQIQAFLAENGLTDLAWFDADIVHANVETPAFADMLEALRKRRTLVIGPDHLQAALWSLFGCERFVNVPARQCFRALRTIVMDAKQLLQDAPPTVVSVSASMPAEIIIDMLWDWVGHRGHSFIDYGSVWDPYGGRFRRSYQRAMRSQGRAWPR